MDERDWLTQRFEEHRSRLRAVAYRMLGSVSEADDAVQDAWVRISRAGADDVENVDGWLTTVVARVCLNMLRTRERRREEPLDVRVPDPIVSRVDGVDPEHEALLADSVGLAMFVVLETLAPAERIAFVLHDMFAVPFGDIASMIERSPAATRQLASRARRRVRGQAPTPDADLARQRDVVDAFFAASRDGDFDALVAVLDPDVVLRSDGGTARARLTFTLRGAQDVAKQAFTSRRLSPFVRPALVNGAAGVVVATDQRPLFVMAFTVTGGKIVAIDVLADPERIDRLDLTALNRNTGQLPSAVIPNPGAEGSALLLSSSHVDEIPERYLAGTGTIFARFDQQDSGNVSYGVQVEGTRYFVKTAGHPDDDEPALPHDERVTLLRNAIRIGRTYQHPALPALRHTIESPHGPMLVYDWAHGELIGAPRQRRDDPDSAFQRFRRLPTDQIVTCLDTIVDIHDMLGQAGEVMGDFYDGCLLYDFATQRLSVIDLDSYNPGPHTNEVGRLPGSTRFMAPEEFTEGARIDQRTSVYTLGRTVLVLLSDTTTDPDAFRGPVALYDVALRACRPDPDHRYRSIPEFCMAWRDARANSGTLFG